MPRTGSSTSCVRYSDDVVIQNVAKVGTNRYVKIPSGESQVSLGSTATSDSQWTWRMTELETPSEPPKPVLTAKGDSMEVTWTIPAASPPVTEIFVGIRAV